MVLYPCSGFGGKIFVLWSIRFNRESIDSRFLHIKTDEMQKMLNIFSRALVCGFFNLKGAGFSIILYLYNVSPHFYIEKGTRICENQICQESHMIDIGTLTDEER